MDDELRQLPGPKAPGTLIPKVFAAIHARQAIPWYRRPWFEWPRRWQVLSVIAISLLVAGLEWLALNISLPDDMKQAGRDVVVRFASTTRTMWVCWQSLVRPCALYLLAAASIALMLCGLLGSAVVNVVKDSREVRAV